MARVQLPVGLDRARHAELSGRRHQVWGHRAVLVVVAAVPVAGLLNVFGQHAAPTTYPAPAASLLIDSPSRVRGGLTMTTEIVITPHQQLNDARLYLDNGWFKAMTYNGAAPQPSTETAGGPWQIWDYGQLPAGTPFHVWISWQTNPTNVGTHPQNVALFDGDTQVVTAERDFTVFP